jgi:hypothetical protein
LRRGRLFLNGRRLLLEKAVHAPSHVKLFVPSISFLGTSRDLILVALAEVVGRAGGGAGIGHGDGGGVAVKVLGGLESSLLLL